MNGKRINRRRFVSALGSGALLAGRRALRGGQQPSTGRRLPNIVIIYTDDQGYADVGVFGARGFATPQAAHCQATIEMSAFW